jgi:hypothetical protein
MAETIDRTGERFGILTAVEPTHKELSSGRMMPAWRLRCDCGNEVVAMTVNLTKGKHQSCGCARRELSMKSRGFKGHTSWPEYRVYRQMLDRCYLESAENYVFYGGRGISVCDRWRFGEDGKRGFECFIADMGRRPDGLTLDRVGTNGNYEPGNCRWATWEAQRLNMRSNRYLTVGDETKTIGEWAAAAGVSNNVISDRLARGWPVEKAISPTLKHWERGKGKTSAHLAEPLCAFAPPPGS